MRRFSPEYLRATRDGMWAGSRDALVDLDLGDADAVLDVGCGTGALTRVLREETEGTVVGLDADVALLAAVTPPVVRGDARNLPVPTDHFDVVVCQALLVNLPVPGVAIREFSRVSRDVVAAIEPDNDAVTVTSTVDGESALAREARALYVDGVVTDVTLGADAREYFESADLDVVSTKRYLHEQIIEPPYSPRAIEGARRKASGDGLTRHEPELLAATDPETVDDLRNRWRAMGREAIAQMQDGAYRRTERVPFYVTVARV